MPATKVRTGACRITRESTRTSAGLRGSSRSLVVDAPRTKVADRDLFDLETDEGASYVELPRGCRVRLRGVFGDQLHLTSSDMPRPVTTTDNERRYAFSGRLKADALIHSITED